MEKINLVELLKDCPEGMELDCTMYEDVCFYKITDDPVFPVRIKRIDGAAITLTKYGGYADSPSAKCVIFPKGKTTWEGFVPPCKFKDGDVITCNNSACTFIAIFKEQPTEKSFKQHCSVILDDNKFIVGMKYADYANPRFATEEEKQKLFQAIKDNGYKWNAETKTLEKLPKFKVGDKIKRKGDTRLTTIKDIRDNYYIITIPNFFDNAYITDKLLFINQDEYEIVPNKFDINVLVPFETRVLVRNENNNMWKPAIFGYYAKDKNAPYYIVGGTCWSQCMPYKYNKHLLGKTDDCDEYFKTWK